MQRDELTQEFALSKMRAIENEAKKFLIGIDDSIQNLVLGLFTGVPYSEGDRKNIGQGHTLLMAAPGAGKTDLGRTIGSAIDSKFSFLGFNPEMKMSDFHGSEIYDQISGKFFFAEGPVYSHIVLADEVNRGHPKVQASLLQTMEERISITSRLDSILKKVVNNIVRLYPIKEGSNKLIFWLVATGNQFEQEGTYPIPEAQLDRFTLCFAINPPKRKDEIRVRLNNVFDPNDESRGPRVNKVVTLEEVWDISRFILRHVKPVSGTSADEAMMRFIENSRPRRKSRSDDREFASPELKKFVDNYVKAGLSTRANFHFEAAARTMAFRRGENFISIDDVKDVARMVMPHRILLKPLARGRNISQQDVVEEILRLTDLP